MAKGQAITSQIQKRFERAGFEILESATGVRYIEIKKYNCGLLLECTSSGEVKPMGTAGYWTRLGLAKIEDRGYQKFWWIKGKRLPALAEQLRALHAFEMEVWSLIGIKSLYNEALGTRSTRTVYDRLRGRPQG